MIIFVHLLNDHSGSPKVLASVIEALRSNGKARRLFVGSNGCGFLDNVGVPITRYWYWRGTHRLVTLFTYLYSQASLVMRLLRSKDLPPDAVLYINTLLPFGAALYGALTRRPVVYHLHEVSVSPTPLRWFLLKVARHTAYRLIYVSDFHRAILPINSVPAVTVYNALDEDFLVLAKSSRYAHLLEGFFNVLMLASLRDYKGVHEFTGLADSLQTFADIRFHLVVNDNEAGINRYFAGRTLPPNLTVHPRTDDPAFHYAKSSLVLNLSRPDQWVETFGLTILEAMAFGIPVIVPPVGGPTELVEDGVQGFWVDSRDSVLLRERVLQLFADQQLCLRMSQACRRRAAEFSPEIFAASISALINRVMRGEL